MKSSSTKIKKAFKNLKKNMGKEQNPAPIPFRDFLSKMLKKPYKEIRNVFLIFSDMIKNYVGEGFDEYTDDPESINFSYYVPQMGRKKHSLIISREGLILTLSILPCPQGRVS